MKSTCHHRKRCTVREHPFNLKNWSPTKIERVGSQVVDRLASSKLVRPCPWCPFNSFTPAPSKTATSGSCVASSASLPPDGHCEAQHPREPGASGIPFFSPFLTAPACLLTPPPRLVTCTPDTAWIGRKHVVLFGPCANCFLVFVNFTATNINFISPAASSKSVHPACSARPSMDSAAWGVRGRKGG